MQECQPLDSAQVLTGSILVFYFLITPQTPLFTKQLFPHTCLTSIKLTAFENHSWRCDFEAPLPLGLSPLSTFYISENQVSGASPRNGFGCPLLRVVF